MVFSHGCCISDNRHSEMSFAHYRLFGYGVTPEVARKKLRSLLITADRRRVDSCPSAGFRVLSCPRTSADPRGHEHAMADDFQPRRTGFIRSDRLMPHEAHPRPAVWPLSLVEPADEMEQQLAARLGERQ